MSRWKTAGLLALVTLGGLLSAAATSRARTSTIEVGIAVGVEEVRFEVTGEAECRGAAEIRRLGPGRALTARVSRGRILLQPAEPGADLVVYEVADSFRVQPLSSAALMIVDRKRYRGGLKIFRSPNGRINVVNVLDVEDYLRGVLPHEIGRLSDQTIEAGKAQAIAARTYALSYIGRRADEGFDVYDTVEDQLYGGVGDEGALTDRCVRETGGMVGLYQGRFMRANYFSTCGGVTANIEDVWPEPPLPWLRSVADHAGDGGTDFCKISGQYRWTEIWEPQEFLDIINRTFPEYRGKLPRAARRLDDVRVESRSPSGRVARLIISADVGELTVRGDLVRRVLARPKRSVGVGGPGGILRSAFFKISVVRSSDGTPYAVVASGAGYGHGVGMCQMGAIAMARQGYDYRNILHHYYTDIEIERP
jgi:stage II sporulation protein D